MLSSKYFESRYANNVSLTFCRELFRGETFWKSFAHIYPILQTMKPTARRTDQKNPWNVFYKSYLNYLNNQVMKIVAP